MSNDLSLVPQYLALRGNKTLENVICVFVGFLLMSLLAQITIRLWWTPVPITGQTFGVSLIALTWGRKRGLAVMMTYLTAGAIGLPIFAMGGSGLSFGPTFGYLLGMAVATYWVGWLCDKGWTKTWLRTYLAAASGSAIVFACGVIVLSFFIPRKDLFVAGVSPFLIGDLLKTILASSIAFQLRRSTRPSFKS
jgi:biotin transport system substrate-specific component